MLITEKSKILLITINILLLIVLASVTLIIQLNKATQFTGYNKELVEVVIILYDDIDIDNRILLERRIEEVQNKKVNNLNSFFLMLKKFLIALINSKY